MEPTRTEQPPSSQIEDDLRELEEKHALLAARVEAFDDRVWLSVEERSERKRLQKLKLATKDRIAALRALQN